MTKQKFTVILVGSEHDSNVGSVARVMKNFDFHDLFLVSPSAPIGFEAIKFAKHSNEILTNAKRFTHLAPAIKDMDLVIATSGVADRFSSELKNSIISFEISDSFSDYKRIGIVFGRESSGLTEEEIKLCDVVCFIPASKQHQVLNLSHAVGVILYEIYRSRKIKYSKKIIKEELKRQPASRKNRQLAQEMFFKLANSQSSVRHPKKVSNAFKNIVERSKASNEEIKSVVAVLSPLIKTNKKIETTSDN